MPTPYSEYDDNRLPSVSLIIVTYNGGRFIRGLLDSLYEQRYPASKIDIIVVDNASVDGTAAIIEKEFPNVRVIRLAENLGYAAGNNRGVAASRDDYLVFLNQDTVCHNDWLRGLITVLQANPDIGVCTSNLILPGHPAFAALDRERHLPDLYYYDMSFLGYAKYYRLTGQDKAYTKIFTGCSFALKREMIGRCGYLFDEDLWMYAEDTDLSLRLHNSGFKICAVRESIVFHLHGANANLRRIQLFAHALMNRVFVLFKNMNWTEFVLYYPVLLIGGIFKIFDFPIRTKLKPLLFIPYALFSMECMLLALFRLPRFQNKRRRILAQRIGGKNKILRLVVLGEKR